jgi:hypothetical protein
MSKRKQDEQELSEALKMTFPASDPITVGSEDKAERVRVDRQPATLDRDLVERLSRQVKKRATRPSN